MLAKIYWYSLLLEILLPYFQLQSLFLSLQDQSWITSLPWHLMINLNNDFFVWSEPKIELAIIAWKVTKHNAVVYILLISITILVQNCVQKYTWNTACEREDSLFASVGCCLLLELPYWRILRRSSGPFGRCTDKPRRMSNNKMWITTHNFSLVKITNKYCKSVKMMSYFIPAILADFPSSRIASWPDSGLIKSMIDSL